LKTFEKIDTLEVGAVAIFAAIKGEGSMPKQSEAKSS
jgi:hypothetical protein